MNKNTIKPEMTVEGKTLHLTLKKKWFDMIASGEKKEEYRDIKQYWIRRLLIDLECCEEYSWGGMESI